MDGLMEHMSSDGSRRRLSSSQRVAAFTDDAALSDSLARLADGTAIPWIDVQPGGLDAALKEQFAATDVAIVDISKLAEREALAGIQALSGNVSTVIAVGTDNDVALYRALTAAGAHDYLVQPLDERSLGDALIPRETAGRAAGAPTTEEDVGKARVNLVIGARGGVGASTLAVDAAWWAAERLGVQTGLLDYDLHFGSCALALDLMPGRGLRDALESPERIDSLFVGSAMMNASDSLFVLAAEEAVEEDVFIAPDAPTRVLSALADSFPCVVADLPRSMAAAYPGVLEAAHSITLVSELTLLGLRDALRLKKLCAQVAPDASLALALRQPSQGKGAIDQKEFAKGYGAAPDWMLPYLPKAAADAAGRGKPLVSMLRRSHGMAKAVRAIAERCVDPAGVAPPKRKKLLPWRT